MDKYLELLGDFFNTFIFYYAVTLCFSYFALAIISAFEMRFYMKKNSFIDYRTILSSHLQPSISLIAPAYNEGANIVENVRSLLSIHYGNYEVIIVNDGSKDDSMDKLIDHYDLVRVDFAVNELLQTKTVKGVYKSRNSAFSKLTIVDKENGGKSDALNVGLNISQSELVACVDVDCVIEQDALVKMVKPFIEEEEKVIATGGVVRVANSCEIENGKLIKINLPEEMLPRIQVVEYIRAFLMGRMAWSRLNGLLIISGAFGLFDREIAIKCGGYNHKTVGEDMELVVRMRIWCHENKIKYRVVYIPDPLCWTEAPSSLRILSRQRNRWARGTAETLWFHKKIFLNPKYGLLGFLSYPFWLFYEWLAPFIEFFGVMFYIILAILGFSSWQFFVMILSLIYAFAVLMSISAVLFEELSYHQYNKKSDMVKLITTALLEPVLYHPLTVKWSLEGNIDLLSGRKSWGEMTRVGLGKKKPEPVKPAKAADTNAAENEAPPSETPAS